MINIFISRNHTYTIEPFLKTWQNKAASSIRLVPYESIHRIQSIEPGLFIFSDIDRLTEHKRQMARELFQKISDNFDSQLILNNPSGVLSRCQLLSALWEKKINHFRVYSLSGGVESMRYPVFIRRANDHNGSLTDLIISEKSFYDECRKLKKHGENYEQLIAVEFCDTRGPDGLFRKYSAFRIGDVMIPGHIIFSEQWVTKEMPPEALKDEEKEYLEKNPHKDELSRIFRLANIEYGRIDYGLFNGKIQVWEINTNPVLIQEQKKYAKEKLAIKQKLVDELADALLKLHARAEISREKDKIMRVKLTSSNFLYRLRQCERMMKPFKI